MNNALPDNWIELEDSEEIAQAVTTHILKEAEKAIAAKGSFNFVTAGGTTPNRCYELLAEQKADWQNWHLYMGDERCYPVNHPDRNSVALQQHWLSKQSSIPESQIHFMPTELGLENAAQQYNTIIEALFARGEQFDVSLLGMGEDGHTASLFPGHFYIEDQFTVLERQSPKPPEERLSLSYETLCSSQIVIKVVTGASKKDVVHQWLKGENLPIANIYGLEATFTYLSSDVLSD